MAETYKFPNGGYDVTVCKKQDILDCIDENIVDKEVLSEIISQCEKDAADFITSGRWTGIPFIGSVRIPEGKLIEEKLGQKELIQEVRETLDSSQYLLFRKQLAKDNTAHIKQQRYFNYIVARMASKNKRTYKYLCNKKGERYAKLFMFFIANATYIPGDNEQQITYRQSFSD